MQATRSYQELDDDIRWRVEELYNDYFYRRQEDFWQARGYEKLPAMRKASPMLLCGEDLGMVPACVPGVMKELGILSLEIQRMPKTHEIEFFNPAHAPYMSVVSPSTHDMSTLRAWWKEDSRTTAKFAWQMFGIAFPAVRALRGTRHPDHLRNTSSPRRCGRFSRFRTCWRWTSRSATRTRKRSGSTCRRSCPFYWRYRMHLGIDELAAADGFNRKLRRLLEATGR